MRGIGIGFVALALIVAVSAGTWFTVGPGAGPPTGGCTEAAAAEPATAEDPTRLPSVEWRAAELPEGLDGPAEQIMLDVAVVRDAFVAVGRSSSGGASNAFLLSSADGVSWRAQPDDARRFAGTGLSRLTAAGDRLFAIGSTSTDDRGGSRTAVWHTDDGLAWVEAHGPFADTAPTAMAAGDDGLLMLGVTTDEATPVAWRSRSGDAWESQELDLPTDESQAGFGALAALGDGWHAAGFISNGPDAASAPVIWRSGDGIGWSCSVLDAADFGRAHARSLTGSGRTWVATGDASEGCGLGASCPGVGIGWVSNGGLSWSAPLTDSGPIMGATALAAFDGGYLAIAYGRTWLSLDGASWSVLDAVPLDGQVDALAIRSDGHLVAVGTIQRGTDSDPLVVVGELVP